MMTTNPPMEVSLHLELLPVVVSKRVRHGDAMTLIDVTSFRLK
jgi:hypothetical protein